MPLAFRYPAPTGGSTGAVMGSALVTACGTFNSVSGTPSIFGKVYPGTAAPADFKPPPGASQGTCVGNGSGNPTWHFNGCSPSLGSCMIGSMHTMRIWVTGTNESCYFTQDCVFQGCDATAAGCSVDCPASAPGEGGGGGPGPAAHCPPVIEKVASRFFVVRPAPGIEDLMDLFGVGKAVIRRWNIQLAYSEDVSSLGMAVWLSEEIRGERLRLEVTCGSCCTQALLARIRMHKTFVETVECWHASCFDVVYGGNLCRLTPAGPGTEGSVSVRPPYYDGETAPAFPVQAPGEIVPPPPGPAPPVPEAPAAAPRTSRRRRTGRGRG
jgi:hypothetical protein